MTYIGTISYSMKERIFRVRRDRYLTQNVEYNDRQFDPFAPCNKIPLNKNHKLHQCLSYGGPKVSRQFQLRSRQFQFHHGNFNFVHGNFNFTTAISTSFTAISISSRQFQFHHGNFNFITAISTSFTAISTSPRQFQFCHGNFNFIFSRLTFPFPYLVLRVFMAI